MVLQYLPFPSSWTSSLIVDDSDDELYEPLMDDNESNAISELLVYLENVPPPFLRRRMWRDARSWTKLIL
jgi:hypothetical protein